MNDFSVKLETFEGPMDLMLDSIVRKKLNIFDIDISVILDCFLDYISVLRENRIEAASEFIDTAAKLVYIKTALLLPKHKDEALEMKKELEGRLVDKALLFETVKTLSQMWKGSLVFTRKPMVFTRTNPYQGRHGISELLDNYRNVLHTRTAKNMPVKQPTPVEIAPHSYVTVFTKVVYILKRLVKYGVYPMPDLYSGQSRSEQAAIFLALLNLLKTGRTIIRDYDDSAIQYLEFVGRNKDI